MVGRRRAGAKEEATRSTRNRSLSRKRQAFYRKRIAGIARETVLPLLENPGDALPANIASAIQFAADLGLRDAAPAIRRLAFDDSASTHLRLNSIHILGRSQK